MSNLRRSDNSNEKYGIVIDSGSSGSRIQIYKWTDQKFELKSSKDQSVLQSPPKITQEKGWTKKITPGISTYNSKDKFGRIWQDHYSELLKFAEGIIPSEKQPETPVFVLSTAGMRLLPKKTQKSIVKETCTGIKQNTNFYIPTENCENFVEIIDGSTEGIYGWLGLNYLMKQFNNYDSSQDILHESIGFMDMGGASTQIAFVPSSKEQITKHKEDLSTVTLRNINGETQTWDLFVATWLGFGANQARKRFLNQLINLAIVNGENWNSEINDPCLPKGASMEYNYENKKYLVKGVGNYEMCIKTIYPLLMKNMVCIDEPCLFNGIHGPKFNFEKDKFIGISEYWYTANDIFQSGGEYNFKTFNAKVKEYCESNWDEILKNSEQGQYSKLDPDKFLKDACFKASWVMNVLHEGFELPRIGKILLFASSQIEPKEGDTEAKQIGIYPSQISGHKFVPGGVLLSSDGDYSTDDEDDDLGGQFSHILYSLIFVLWTNKFRRFQIPVEVKRAVNSIGSKIPGVRHYFENIVMFSDLQDQNIILEEGIFDNTSSNNTNFKSLQNQQQPASASVLRTRSAIGLNEDSGNDHKSGSAQSLSNFNSKGNNYYNKSFSSPNKNIYISANNSRESLARASSNASIPRSKSSLD
ncbi:GDA1/CD39 (nucleoside phosphatase) family protein [Candida albicans]|uniref:GDA1/CD39 (Nucleoside phosphatase) family protein n=1 Tax=Candida albicans TaxID=5476 RepID=A0A8H6C450_CANAX|nr:GDA1/CD39 (nucleoside phosphatase) family protein [Candida albicans]